MSIYFTANNTTFTIQQYSKCDQGCQTGGKGGTVTFA